MTHNHKPIRINKRMVAWSDGHRLNVVPSEWRKVDDYGSTLRKCHGDLREGDRNYYGTCLLRREECRCLEHEADRCWERGQHLQALDQMISATSFVLPDEADDIEFEDVCWLDPDEMVYWHPNVREFMRLARRCEDLCRRHPRLWPILEADATYRAYRRYLRTLGRWVHST
ncbi:MAG: hypothetical protein J6I49_08755 [Bacteroidales bacterium]|nr:hypothetical protein [Bacteroidales bacterium]